MRASLRPAFVIMIALSLVGRGFFSPSLRAEDARDRLTRIAPTSIIADSGVEGRLLKKKLYVTRDEVARYVFLTNGNDGDRSVAVYRRGKVGSVKGNYWITATEAPIPLTRCIPYEGRQEPYVDPNNVVVQRYDAPLPFPIAQVLHKLWLAMLEQSQPEDILSLSPTGIFSATNASGTRLRAATSWLGDNSISLAMIQLGESLVNYPKLPTAKRPELAHQIEKESKRLLERIAKARNRGQRGSQ